jgi:hypothetical protein
MKEKITLECPHFSWFFSILGQQCFSSGQTIPATIVLPKPQASSSVRQSLPPKPARWPTTVVLIGIPTLIFFGFSTGSAHDYSTTRFMVDYLSMLARCAARLHVDGIHSQNFVKFLVSGSLSLAGDGGFEDGSGPEEELGPDSRLFPFRCLFCRPRPHSFHARTAISSTKTATQNTMIVISLARQVWERRTHFFRFRGFGSRFTFRMSITASSKLSG